MNVVHMIRWCMVTAVVGLGTTIGLIQHLAAQQPPQQQQTLAASQEGVEVLTRGPVHEAFAATITFEPEPGLVIPEAPPDPIEEIAPDQRPRGANVAWIPGYWAWDDQRSDFLWVSGIWRALPPDRQWVPGYWGQSQQGYQWTSGYGADAAASEIDYLPEPPAMVETGPSIAAPSADSIWLPGSWIWQQNRYAWRAGYWAQGQQGWDWVPDHYVWTPSGYVFVNGYYDYSVPRRGVVFAPVYFSSSVRTQRGFSYSPSTVINSGVFTRHLFLRPSYGHYYFGDYYASNYTNAGFTPWFSYHTSRRGYDPIYANQRWQHRNDREWEQRAEANFRHLRDNESARPPHNWAAQRELAARTDRSNRRNIAVAAELQELARRRGNQLRFQAVDAAERQQAVQRRDEYRQYLQRRQQLEATAARTPGSDPASAADATRRPISRSPFVAPTADQLGREYRPPQRHEVLKPDPQVQPQPRNRGPAQRQQAQQQQRRGNQGDRQGPSAGQSREDRGADRGADRGQSPGASRDESPGAQRNAPRGQSERQQRD